MATQAIKLPQSEVVKLQQSEHALSALLTEMDKAESCGIDCAELKAMAQELIERSQKLRANFGQ